MPAPVALLALALAAQLVVERETKPVARAATGGVIPHPTAAATYPVTDAGRTVRVPVGMVYVPAGAFTVGTGRAARAVTLDGFAVGRFSVTNAEYQAFVAATGRRAPRYWANGTYPVGKANHPVVWVSLADAKAYAGWMGRETGWAVAVPTADQWEKAARGPRNTLYPWGDGPDVTFRGGVLATRFNFNAVTAAHYLTAAPDRPVVYDHPKSKYRGTRTTVAGIAGYDDAGRATPLSVGPTGSVRGWVSHGTYTGFIYTDLYAGLNATGGNTSAVGAYPAGASGYGCHDMAGNVWNWCDSTLVATNGAEKGTTVNEIRGGSWYANGTSCKSVSVGEGRAAGGAYHTVGFRIVVTPR